MDKNMRINSNYIIDAAANMPIDEKLKLYDKIKDDIIQFRVEEIFRSFRTDELSDEEITRIVENVRTERYKDRH